MTFRMLLHLEALFIMAIARMLGKAVKFRHCPATVSASRSVPVFIGYCVRMSARAVSFSTKCPEENHWTRTHGVVSGKVAEAGASQETGPRRF